MTLKEMDRKIKMIRLRVPLSPKQLDELKRQRRLLSNKLYARESRRKKREELDRLGYENERLRKRIQILEEENIRLRTEVSLFSQPPVRCTLFDDIFSEPLF